MTRIVRNTVLMHCLLALAGACSSGSSNDDDPEPLSTPPTFPSQTGDHAGVDPGPDPFIPTDTRAPRVADKPPVPITGGTLIATADGKHAVAADPDRDRVSVVDITNGRLTHTIALETGDEPGRLVEDDQGRVHVALRRGGAVASLDIATGTVIERRAVCAAPRGIAFDASERTLRVACASGELVTLPVDSGEPSERLQLDSDLRDVLIAEDGMLVTRFKRAELLHLPAGWTEVQTRRRPPFAQAIFEVTPDAFIGDTLESELAWRTASDGDGGYVMVHQGAREGSIALEQDEPGAAGNGLQPLPPQSGTSRGSYGGGGACSGVVQTELTRMDANGEPVSTVGMDAVLAVDVAVAPVSGWIVIVQAGDRDLEQPVASLPNLSADPAPSPAPIANVMAFDLGNLNERVTDVCVGSNAGVRITGQATAVAFRADDTLLVQTREPAAVTIVRSLTSISGVVVDGVAANMVTDVANSNPVGDTTRIELGGQSVYDTGHELFHRDAGAGIACASCHAEGGDDGHVWNFTGVGPRRTQTVDVGLEGTAPFHWSGDQPGIAALMEDVFVTRMGGVHESGERVAALQGWLFAQTPPPAQRAADDAAALRGKTLFDGEAECATCHNGEALTNNMTVDVGTGEALQVPSLHGVGYRAPLIHDGCAASLIDRFDPDCGGAKHGKTAQLSASQIDDMIAYLQTL